MRSGRVVEGPRRFARTTLQLRVDDVESPSQLSLEVELGKETLATACRERVQRAAIVVVALQAQNGLADVEVDDLDLRAGNEGPILIELVGAEDGDTRRAGFDAAPRRKAVELPRKDERPVRRDDDVH